MRQGRWINSGSGIMDFEKEVRTETDIFFVNTDGPPAKQAFAGLGTIGGEQAHPHGFACAFDDCFAEGMQIPYRIEMVGMAGSTLCQSIRTGSVIVMAIQPQMEFNHRSGMATSSRQTAIRLWHTAIPEGDRQELAHTLFCVDNPPGTRIISGSQDHLGLLLPGINKLNYDNGYWPVSIESKTDRDTLEFVQRHVSLIALPPRRDNYSPLSNTDVTAEKVLELARQTERIWDAILKRDVEWGAATTRPSSAIGNSRI